MEQLSLVCSGSSEADLTSSGLGSGGRNVVVKPVIPPKPEGYGTLGRSGHRSENGSSSAEQNRMSYSSQRPKSTEMLTDFASTSTTSRQSPRSPRSKPPAPPVPSSSGSGGSGGGASCVGNSNGSTRLPPPPPSVASLSLADGQGSLLAGLALDCPCPLPPLLSSSSTSQLQHQSGGPGSKSSAFEPPQLSVWNPLIEPPQLFQTSMDVDLSAAFDSLGQVDPPPLPPPTVNNSCSSGSSSHTPADSHSITSHLVITKPAPPPPSLSQSQSQVSSSSSPASSSSTSSSATSTTTSSSSTSSFHSYSGAEPIKPVRIDPPRLPSVPPVAHSGLSLQLDPLSRPYSSASTTRTVTATSTTAAEPPLQYISSGSSSSSNGAGGGGGSKPILPITNELNKLFKADQAQGNSYSSGGAGNSGYSSSSGPSRMEPRVTTDLVRLTEPNRISVEHHSHSTAVSTPTEPFKPSRVLPLKPFPDPPGTAGGGGSGALVPALHNQQQQQQQQLQTTTGKSTSATVSDRPSSDRQSLDSIHSNPSTIDTTDSPRSLLASNDTLNTPSNTQQRNTPESQKNQQQGPLGPSQQQQQQANGRVEHSNSTDSAAKNTSGPAVPPNVLQPAPSAPAAPPPSSSSSSYMTIDIDRGDPSMAGNTGGTVSSGAGGGGGGGGSEPGTEKVVDFYPPHSFVPYSFHSECWRKEIPDNETKWQMYKRRFCEFVFEFTACCIRCIGPV